MPISIQDFWKLAVASGLLSPERCRALHAEYKNLKGAAQHANSRSLAEWLVAGGVLTRYQASSLAAGRPGPFVFGEFTITERIEAGRLAPWFRATANDRRWLIIFAAQLTADAEQYEAVAERAQWAMTVKSPHVSRVHRFIDDQPPLVVVEALQGKSLREHFATPPLPLQAACRIAFEAALGLVALHEQKLVHGGIRPDNLWIDTAGATKILQFPCQADPLGIGPVDVPAVDYLAPEQTRGGRPPDHRADIYGLGCTLYELVAGRLPFPGGTVQQKITRHQSEVAQRLDKLDPSVPEDLADLVAEMLDKEPELRCQSASHVAHLLAPLVSGAKPHAARPPQQATRNLTPGYGAWKAPDWQPPPRQFQATPRSPAAVRAVEPPVAPAEAVVPVESVAPSDTPTVTSAQEPGIPPIDSELIAAFEETPFPARAIRRPATGGLSGAVMIGGSVLLAAAIIVALLLSRGGSDESPEAPAEPAMLDDAGAGEAIPQAEPNDDTAADADAGAGETQSPAAVPPPPAIRQIDDDGKTLWASPTAGELLAVQYLPSGIQAYLVLRPVELLASAEGARMVAALGPSGERARAQLRSILGVELAEIEQLAIACYPDDSGAPQAAFVMRLLQQPEIERLLAAWNAAVPAKHGGRDYFKNDHWAYWLPAEEHGRVVAIVPRAAMPEVLDLGGRPLVPKGFERLLRHSDAARHVNLMVVPRYFMTDGASLLTGDLERLRDPLLRFFDGGIEAALLSAHVDDALFLELRVASPADRRAADVAVEMKTRLADVAERLKTLVESNKSGTYGQAVIERLPQMVQLASEFSRQGVEDRQAVLSCYLPLAAAHNLLLGAELALSQPSSAVNPAEAKTPSTASPPSVRSALQKPISLSFPRDTLERAIELLSQEMGTKIVILGADLRRDGITKNQSFEIDERQQPAGEILRKILARSSPDGKLVYVIRGAEGGGEAIFITTRSAALERGDAIGEESGGKSTKVSR
jgi:hypothetical protein